jgi:hypothetical protein
MFPQIGNDQEDYIAPDEMRRRQALSSIMAPDEEEGEMAVKPDNAQLTPAELAYQKAAAGMPDPSKYKPSIFRRIGAALAGAGAGWRNPAQGVEVANAIDKQPYNNAMEAWQARMQQAGTGLKLDEQMQNRQNQQTRAQASVMNAQARQTAAQATEDERKWQMNKPQPWVPTTKEDAEELESIKRPPKAPSQFDEEWGAYQQDPDKYQAFKTAGQKPSTAETQDDRVALEKMREAAEMSRTRMVQDAITGRQKQAQPKSMSPTQQIAAEALAKTQLLRAHPEYQQFIKGGQIITPDQLPRSAWYNKVSPAQESLARTQYQQFLSDLDKQKKQVMGQSAGTWNIEEDDQ